MIAVATDRVVEVARLVGCTFGGGLLRSRVRSSTSLHVGIVEAAYPGYLVTIEGDALDGVRRFVVPTRNPQRIGEPGPIYAYASPVSRPSAQRYRARVRALATLAAPRRGSSVGHQSRHLPSLELRRLLRTIAALRAFQHMPYRIGQARIERDAVGTLR